MAWIAEERQCRHNAFVHSFHRTTRTPTHIPKSAAGYSLPFTDCERSGGIVGKIVNGEIALENVQLRTTCRMLDDIVLSVGCSGVYCRVAITQFTHSSCTAHSSLLLLFPCTATALGNTECIVHLQCSLHSCRNDACIVVATIGVYDDWTGSTKCSQMNSMHRYNCAWMDMVSMRLPVLATVWVCLFMVNREWRSIHTSIVTIFKRKYVYFIAHRIHPLGSITCLRSNINLR